MLPSLRVFKSKLFFIFIIAAICFSKVDAASPDRFEDAPIYRRVTGKQREQLLQLRGIVENAIKSNRNGTLPGSTVDRKLSGEEKAYHRLQWANTHWWKSKPFVIGSISACCVAIAILLLLCVLCSPSCQCNKCLLSTGRRGSEHESLKKVGFAEEVAEEAGGNKNFAYDWPTSPYGVIRYRLKYDTEKEHLLVTVKDCSDLPNTGRITLNPYVIVRVAFRSAAVNGDTDNEQVVTTPMVQDTGSPEFNFPCSFPVAKSDLPNILVKMEVYNHESHKEEHSMLARYSHALRDRRNGHQVDDVLEGHDFERKLKRGRRETDVGPGDICVLLHRQEAGQDSLLRVKVIECKGAFLSDADGQPDTRNLPNTYVDLMLTEPHGRIHARRTETVCKNRNPYFNEEFRFAVPGDKLRQCALRLTLVHVSDFLRAKKAIGSVELSADEDGELGNSRLAREHWLAVTQSREMTGSSQVAKCSWHSLMPPDEELKLRRNRAFGEKQENQ